MSTTTTPQGGVVSLEEDSPRLVYVAPYFRVAPLAEILEPSVQEAVEGMLPSLVPPFVNDAANAAVANLAVLLTGSTMTGPLYLSPTMPTQPSQSASKAYVDTMLSTAGVPEVPAVPAGQTWGRQTGQWVAIQAQTGFLPLTGGTMTGAINMSGNNITNLPAVPILPNGAAPAQWVLNQIAASTLYQGIWNADTNQPDLTQPSTHQNSFTWIAKTTSPTGVVISPPIPGLQGLTVFNGDTVIYSSMAGQFQLLQAGGLTVTEADARYVQLVGSTMTGPLMLSRDPVNAMEAATREWVLANTAFPEAPNDGQVYGRNGLNHSWIPSLPVSGGILTGALTLNGNASTSLNPVPLQQLTSTLGNYVPLAGNVTVTGQLVMTGAGSNLILNSNASQNLQAVPLQQLTSTLGSYAPINSPTFTGTVTIPSGASIAGFAPLASPVFTGDPQAPTPAATDADTSVATTAFVQTAAANRSSGNVGRNLLHNGSFQVAQRGFGGWSPVTGTGGLYSADRWIVSVSNDTSTYSLVNLTDADRAAIGDEWAQFTLQAVVNPSATGGSFSFIQQKIENLRRLSNKTVLVTFWAKSSVATTIGVRYSQSFGTGGSPSTAVFGAFTQWPITTSWQRFLTALAIPSDAGKTFGTNNDSFTGLDIFLNLTGTFGNAATLQFWGMQLEISQSGQTQATPFERISYDDDLRHCQRFYQVGQLIWSGYQTTGSSLTCGSNLQVTMRASPTMGLVSDTSGGVNPRTIGQLGNYGAYVSATTNTTGGVSLNYTYSASADL